MLEKLIGGNQMNIEALKQQLTEGKITKEEYLAELKKLLEAGTISQEQHDEAANVEEGNQKQDEPLTAEKVQEMIAAAVKTAEQSAGDKVRTEYAAKLKAEKEEKERLLKEKMTEEERAKFEKEQHEKQMAEREAALAAKEVELHTIDKLTEAKVSLNFKAFLVKGATTKEEADKNIEAFLPVYQAELKAAVDARFKEYGTNPGQRGSGGGTAKTWKEMTLTEQGNLYKEDREKAITLAKAAGVNLQ